MLVIDEDGHVLERIGRLGNYDGQFRLAHDIAVATDGTVYVVDAGFFKSRMKIFPPAT